MSIEAMNYVTTVQIGNPTRKYVLTRLADRADEKFSCNPSVGLLAAEVEIQPRAVQKHLQALREAGLISDRVARRSDGSQTTNRYYLHGPWDDFGGTGTPFPTIITPRQARAELWAKPPSEGGFRTGTRAAEATRDSDAAGQEGVPYRTSPLGSSGTREGAPSGTSLESPVVITTTEPAPYGRVAPLDARRASTGSRAAGAASGYAASSKTKPRKLSRAERQAVDSVWALLPAALTTAVPRHAHGLEDAILDALAIGRPTERTPEQLVTHRVTPRWDRHWASEFYGGRVDAPVGALRAMLRRDPLCNDDRCDEHVEVDTGQACRACERTREDCRPAGAAPAQPPAPAPARVPAPRPAAWPAPSLAPEPVVDTIPTAESIAQVRAALRAGGGRDRRPYVPTP